MYIAKIEITLRPSILDTQGKATRNALHNLGYNSVEEVRIGKLIEMHIQATGEEEARSIADEACKKLLANEVMENYSIHLEAAETQRAD